MTEVKNPILLNANLGNAAILYPTKASLSLRLCGVSECTMTLPENITVGMHAWVKVFNQNGFVGYFRKTSNDRNIPTDNSITLKHGIDILQDSLWDAETEFSGTKTEFLTALLNKQTALIQGPGDNAPRKPWVLGSCADAGTFKKKISYEDLLSLMQEMEDEGGDYYFSYDQTVWPWTVSYLARSSQVASEFRLNRNMGKCSISENDSELCTRLILNVNKMVEDENLDVDQNSSIYRTYNNTAAQAEYGIIVKTMDIDVTQDTFPNGPFPEADAYAAKYLADRAAPVNTIQIDGEELSGYTGSLWDEAQIGTKCRVALPDYSTYVAERVTGVTYPDLYGTPARVTVTLSNATPKDLRDNESFSRSVSATQKTVARSGGGGRKTARELESFEQHFTLTDENKNILNQAGMKLDAHGLIVYAQDNQKMIGSQFQVHSDKISMVVGSNQDGYYVKAAEIATAINDDGTGDAYIYADHVYIGLDQTIDPDYREKTLNNTFTAITSDFTTVNTLLAKKIEATDINATTVTAALASASLVSVSTFTASNSIGCTGPISGSSISAGGNTLNLVDASVSNDGKTLTITRVTGGAINFNKGDTEAAYNQGWNDCIDAAVQVDRYTRSAGQYGGNRVHYIFNSDDEAVNVGNGWYQTSLDAHVYKLPRKKD